MNFLLFIGSVTFGIIIFLIGSWVKVWLFLKETKKESQNLIEKSNQILNEKYGEVKENINNYRKEKIAQIKQDIQQKEEAQHDFERKINKAEDQYLKQKRKVKNNIFHLRNLLKDNKAQFVNEKERYLRITKKSKSIEENYIATLLKHFQINKEDFITLCLDKVYKEAHQKFQKQAQWIEESASMESEKKARQILNIILNRFQRPYCSERGINFVYVREESLLKKLFENDGEILKIVEQLSGVDIHYNENSQSFSFRGFDPVRRALASLILSKVCRDKIFSERKIKEKMKYIKKDLFAQIKKDGDIIARNLKIKTHPKIKNTLGSLRYRYSFTQNQYFHVEEVGFICGLLCAEMGLDIDKGKKAGVFHDIGKSMDHIIEGTHAVIGADFIKKYGESADVVYAVKAHHHDVPPENLLDFLVIGADALSGARPGARRFTSDNYAQKMSQLESIGKSFKEVNDAYVLNGGKELRVIIDSQKTDDKRTLKLAEEIAQKVEKECVYPGTIKINIIRKTQVVEIAN